jgi:antitoxin (DNA-binding transcriptional repressor) of toxin-antitoxin stability system
MSNKFDSVLKNFLKEESSVPLQQAEQRLSGALASARSAGSSVPPAEKGKFIADVATQVASNPNDPNSKIDPNQQKQIDSFKKILDTTGQNASYGPTQFAKDHPELKDHPQLKSWYTPQTTTPSTNSSSTTPPVGGSSNAFNKGSQPPIK